MSTKNSIAWFRFYEELNAFLPPADRKRERALEFRPPTPVGHLIETLGVPHTEVELIIANGHSVGLDYCVQDDDHISVYPVFERLDISPLLRIRDRPLRNPCFLADVHLGKLAHHLRMLGFDTRFQHRLEDAELAAISVREQRILLTRDRALLMRKAVTHGCYIRSLKPKQQLQELLQRLDLYRLIQPFTRCLKCNGRLVPVGKEEVLARLPEDTRRHFDAFWQCRDCHRVYWKGSHYERMQAFIGQLRSAAETF